MASPNISFSNIPASIRKPGRYFEFNTALAVRTLPNNLQKTLIVGQRLSTGTVAANTVVDVFSDADAATYFGRGSIAHLMVRAALQANPYLTLSVIAMDDAAGVAATNTVTVTGTATASGVLTVNVGDQTVTIAIAATDAQNAIATALKAQFDKQPDLPVTASVATNVVTMTAKNKGTLGNGLRVSSSTTAAGVTVANTNPASGATDPTLATALAVVFASGHHIVIVPWNDTTNLTALRTHLDAVSGPLEQRGAIGVYAHVGTLANATTVASGVNSGRITGILLPTAYESVYEVAAAYGAVIASEEDPARPLNTLALTGILANPLANRLSRTEQESALYNGVTPSEIGPGDKVQIVRAVTTYTLDANSVPDISLLDLTTIRTLDYVRKAVRERITLRFPREKLSSRTADKVRSEILDVLYKLEELEIVEAVADNAAGVLVERDLQDPNRLDAKIPCDVVNGLHVFAGRIDLLL
ncbi:phage tail sheath subtilisin-like domain-containing protein [Accumulibacter sp.]|uniref:phage tail sheath subtilisin-like domain-containing protein n=1 Tax=Accumulibacter sp. TaxID=2053492 RepID=UPI0025D7A2BE|nr:phage tail sheath subtilisin-like domain-containing protein [Accumulibacter sp.]MCM8595134.1 phage tail sheath subtilisin-like domain-containing protein [Accumulibacter sp.]MCM8625520.1 phage tail sheath subtilisin-like domain-containing protein [Accumulibacter sp.]MDS4049280.1 phage tail sheath C-terminal domain-containing protein [Accumulibacter sp.]